MTVFDNAGHWMSIVIFDEELVLDYRKDSQHSLDMRYIDCGLLELKRNLVIDHIEPGGPTDLSEFLKQVTEHALL
jgi:hypothetical protein